MAYEKVWRLENLFGGKEIQKGLQELHGKISSIKVDPTSADFYLELEQLHIEFSEASSLVGCLTAQDTTDSQALLFETIITSIGADLSSIDIDVENTLRQMSDEEFAHLFSDRKIADCRFPFEEMRLFAKKKLPQDKEKLINDLSPSGHDVFTTMYYTYMGEVPFEFRGEKLTLGQLENKLGETDRFVRLDAMHSLEANLKRKENLFAQFLTSIVDYRNTLYEYRGWDNPLTEALQSNRIQEETLNAMWRVVEKNKGTIVKFMRKKAELLGLPKLSWSDYDAPLDILPQKIFSFDEGIAFIIEQFKKVSPRLADFAERSANERWIEADNRKGKRAGGFCTSCPIAQESRIFMNYVGTMGSIATLAHELGHAYHNEILFEKPYFLQEIGMAIAETASTMCEMIVTDGAITQAKTREEKLTLLDDKLSKAISFSCDIHARFIFDQMLHKERKKGPLSPSDLTEMMVKAQKIGFADELSDYLPHFWAYKMHFYFTDIAFYNFPYTMGYLFSLGIYNLLMKTPKDFQNRYDAILLDSGSMTLEDLAKKHLKIDLSEETFWQGAYNLITADVETFCKL